LDNWAIGIRKENQVVKWNKRQKRMDEDGELGDTLETEDVFFSK